MEVLAERLKWLRDKRRLGQKEVAANIDITLSGFQKFEYGESKPKIDTLIKMAQFFNVTTDFLLGLSDNVSETLSLRTELKKYKVQTQRYRAEIDATRHRLYEFETTLSNAYENDKDSNFMKLSIDRYQERLAQLDNSYYEGKMIFDKLLIDYFILFYSIPFSKPEKDNVLKDYVPLDIGLTESVDGSFSIHLKSFDGNTIGTLAYFQSPDRDQNFFKAYDKVAEYKQYYRLDTPSYENILR